jgi:rhodanese-related sulfurtransferase
VKRAHRPPMPAFAAILLLLGAATACERAASISAAELREQQDSGSPLVILDVRTDAEFRRGHIPGAVHIPYNELAGRLGEIPDSSSETIVVYCAVGPRARRAERTLSQNGFGHIVHLNGGFLAWEDAGQPIERSSSR